MSAPPAIPGVKLASDWSAGIGGGLWSTAVVMASYFASNRKILCERLSPPRRALELGSGNGYLGCVLSSVTGGSFPVVITDVGEHLALMRGTVALNSESCGEKVVVEELLWGDGNGGTKERMGGAFDFIFGTDVAYRDYLHQPLIETIDELLAPTGTCILGISLCDTTSSFFDKLDEKGFRFEKINDSLIDPKFRGDMFALIVIERRHRN